MRVTFVTSKPNQAQLPDLALPEIAFIGRSNVGKSSLLNALVQSRIARTSSTPGRTQHINLFKVHAGFGDFALADLPGYGFAKAPKDIRKAFGPMVDEYLRHRKKLHAALLLLDARRGVQPDDLELFDIMYPVLRDRGALSPVIVTKVDKLTKAKKKPTLIGVAKHLGVDQSMVLPTSSLDKAGLDQLRNRIATWVGGYQISD